MTHKITAKTPTGAARKGHISVALTYIEEQLRQEGNRYIERDGQVLPTEEAMAEIASMKQAGYHYLPPCAEAWDTKDGCCPRHEHS